MRNRYESKYLEGRNRFKMTGDTAVKENSIPVLMKIAVSLSNVISTIGLVFTLMGSVFLIIILPLIGLNSVDVPDDSPVTLGEITEIYSTNTEINSRSVLEYHFTYKDKYGNAFKGISYSHNRNERVGDVVNIKYNEKTPEESIVIGMKADEFPMWVLLFVGIFPFTGVIMLYFGLKKGMRNVKIIQYGKVAFGTYKRREGTGSKVNGNTVYKFFFDFTGPDGNTYTAQGETYKIHLLQDEPREPVIYNSTNPSEAVLVDTLPKRVRKFFNEEINKSRDIIG